MQKRRNGGRSRRRRGEDDEFGPGDNADGLLVGTSDPPALRTTTAMSRSVILPDFAVVVRLV